MLEPCPAISVSLATMSCKNGPANGLQRCPQTFCPRRWRNSILALSTGLTTFGSVRIHAIFSEPSYRPAQRTQGLPARGSRRFSNYYCEYLSGMAAILWNAAPVYAPRIPHRAFEPREDTTEIEIPTVTSETENPQSQAPGWHRGQCTLLSARRTRYSTLTLSTQHSVRGTPYSRAIPALKFSGLSDRVGPMSRQVCSVDSAHPRLTKK